jgi:hypothetical protein
VFYDMFQLRRYDNYVLVEPCIVSKPARSSHWKLSVSYDNLLGSPRLKLAAVRMWAGEDIRASLSPISLCAMVDSRCALPTCLPSSSAMLGA